MTKGSRTSGDPSAGQVFVCRSRAIRAVNDVACILSSIDVSLVLWLGSDSSFDSLHYVSGDRNHSRRSLYRATVSSMYR